MHPRRLFSLIAAAAVSAGLSSARWAVAQTTLPSKAASAPTSSALGNKAAKPPTEAVASQSDVASKKPAKPGAQSAPASAPHK